jgi:hypothetical protein
MATELMMAYARHPDDYALLGMSIRLQELADAIQVRDEALCRN